ncbi:MAG TPA: efflux RND transporter periplasmic adaptor subunit, partial [Spongiibacteraceae bacterium]|nr:efflux RND transporter periplasmic adaptor subunit [Spongiibacteraceae bacterium]
AAGEVLATLDTQLLEVDARQLEAQAAEVEARLAQVELELRRQERLIAQGYTAQQRVDELSAEQKVLRAQRQRLAAQRDGVAVRLEKSRLSAPFDGEVLRLEAERGRVVQAGQPLLQLVQTAHNDAVFGVPDQLADALVAGDTVTVSGESGEAGAEALAQVLSVSHSVDPGTLTRTVRVALPDGLAVADSSVIYLHLHEARAEPGAWLPLDALLAGPRGTWAVYALVPDKAGDRNNARDSDKDSGTDGGDTGGHYRLRKHAVSILYQAHDQVYVRTELMVGVPIVSGGLQRLAPDQRVALP